MSQAIDAYYTITASSEFRERERLRAKARHDEAQALHNAEQKARLERNIEIARKLLKRNRPIDEIVEDTGLAYEEVESLEKESQLSREKGTHRGYSSSKWETCRGLPDISMMDELARAFGVSIAELMTGDLRMNENRSANMKKAYFYVCPVCGNVITAVGQGSFSCCGIMLPKQEAEPCSEGHLICAGTVDDAYSVTMGHPMNKEHYISFLAYVADGTLEVAKLYPEQDI